MSVYTAVTGKKNSDLIAEVCRLYLVPGSVVADVTWGRGAFWTSVDQSIFTLLATDIDPSRGVTVADFRQLPYADDSIDIVVLDPPYVHNPGNHMTDTRYNNAATTKGMYHHDIMDLYEEGIKEARRVLRHTGQLWVKCKDEVEGGRQRWSHIELLCTAERYGFYGRDLFVLVPASGTAAGRWKRQLHARKNHSYLWVFDVGCGPRGVTRQL